MQFFSHLIKNPFWENLTFEAVLVQILFVEIIPSFILLFETNSTKVSLLRSARRNPIFKNREIR